MASKRALIVRIENPPPPPIRHAEPENFNEETECHEDSDATQEPRPNAGFIHEFDRKGGTYTASSGIGRRLAQAENATGVGCHLLYSPGIELCPWENVRKLSCPYVVAVGQSKALWA